MKADQEMSEAELELQITACEQFADTLIKNIEDFCQANSNNEDEYGWKVATMMHSIGTMVLAPALAMGRAAISEDEYTDFRARVFQGIDTGCDELYEEIITEMKKDREQAQEAQEEAKKDQSR